MIYRALKKKRGRTKVLTSVIVELSDHGKAIPVKIVFVRNRNRAAARKWLALLSTDTSLTALIDDFISRLP